MLIIHDRDKYNETTKQIIRDCEAAFSEIKLNKDNKNTKFILEFIEQAKPIDEISFEDRFGYKLYKSELSTGCKAAFVTLYNPDKVIDTIECGINAIECIIRTCKNGEILVNKLENISGFGYDGDIDVLFQGIHITTMGQLSEIIGGVI